MVRNYKHNLVLQKIETFLTTNENLTNQSKITQKTIKFKFCKHCSIERETNNKYPTLSIISVKLKSLSTGKYFLRPDYFEPKILQFE